MKDSASSASKNREQHMIFVTRGKCSQPKTAGKESTDIDEVFCGGRDNIKTI